MGFAVNASIVDSAMSGLGVYTVSLVCELIKIHKDLLIYTSHPKVFPQDNVRIRTISRQLGPAYGKRAHLQRLLWSQFILPKNLARDNAKSLFSTIPEGVFGGSVPQYLVVHDVTPLKFPKVYSLQWCYFQLYVRPLLRKAKRVITVSEQTKADVTKFLGISPSQIRVIPGGCNHEIFHVDIRADLVKKKYHLQSYCLYVGNFHPHKNLLRLFQAFHDLAKNGQHQLVIAGKKDPRFFPELQSQVEKLGLHAKVVFLDYVPQEDLPGLYAGAALFILPSLHEGFGLPLVEAMACGVPVIAAKGGAMEEVVEKAGIMVDPTNMSEMADAMNQVLTNSSVRDTLRDLGLRQAQKYSWSISAKMVSQVLDESKR